MTNGCDTGSLYQSMAAPRQMHEARARYVPAVADDTTSGGPTDDAVALRTSRNVTEPTGQHVLLLYYGVGQGVGQGDVYSSSTLAGTRSGAPQEQETVGSIVIIHSPDPWVVQFLKS